MFIEPIDSRRLTGPNLVWNEPGAVLDVQAAACELGQEEVPRLDSLVALWETATRELLDAVGWQRERTRVLWHGGHGDAPAASLALSAPMDGLYAATELNEAAWQLAGRRAAADEPSREEVKKLVTELRQAIAAEHDPALRALRRAAEERGVRCIVDDEHLSLGAGRGSRTWQCSGPFAEHEVPVTQPLPPPEDVPWEELHDIPVALITGTNGKTTTTRLLAAMARAAGKVVALSSTEGVWCNGVLVDAGDYSGPGGARLALRQREADIALLETARGGLLRRGLGVQRADVALITNVAEDHLGEFGIADLAGLARVKAIVARAVEHLVLNWDDQVLRALGTASEGDASVALPRDIQWFSLHQHPRKLHARHRTASAGVVDARLVLCSRNGETTELVRVDEAPLLFGGAAQYNVANALAAALVAQQLGLAPEAMRSALLSFGQHVEDNPGRGNLFRYGSASILADFAHNPHGVEAALEFACGLQPQRLAVVIGQAGDRDDASIAGLAQAVARRTPALVLVKRLAEFSRGRAPGEVAQLLCSELERGGVAAECIAVVDDETAALAALRRQLRPGDVALFTVHSQRQATLDALRALQQSGWTPEAQDPEPAAP